MRILIVNTRHFYGGGDSTYSFSLADLLRSKGHEVNFFAMQDDRNIPDPNSDLFVSNIDFRALNQKKNPLKGFQVLTRSVYSTEAKTKFSKLLERVKPDIVHLQNIHAHITPSIIFEAKRRHIPVVWTLHDYKLMCPNSHFLIDTNCHICEACRGGKFYQAVRNRCKKGSLLASSMASLEAYAHGWMKVLTMVDAFLCPSNFLREKLIENGFPPKKVHHVPLFLPENQFARQTQNQGYILFLGKLETLKGIFSLVEAARKVSEVEVILAGRVEEPLKSQLLQILPTNVKYVGMKSGAELEMLRKNSSALVIPSIWYENQPFSILEMFACGKPVIASNLGGMRELVGENIRGWVVEPKDVQGLSDAMVCARRHDDVYMQKSVNAYEYAKENHNAEKHYQLLNYLYKKVTANA